MDKKQKLRFNSPNNSFDLRSDQLNTDLNKDSTILLPNQKSIFEPIHSDLDDYVQSTHNEEILEHKELSDFHSEPMDFSSILSEKQENTIQKQKRKFFDSKYIHICIYLFLSIVILISYRKPYDYTALLQEIQQIKNNKEYMAKPENLANLTSGCSVGNHSELYRFGFFLSERTDKNSILDPGLECLSLASNSGFFELNFKTAISVWKIAIYHPSVANTKSCLKDFTIQANNENFNFRHDGIGYQEFLFERKETDKIKFIIHNNHGEQRYTSIYRVFVFS